MYVDRGTITVYVSDMARAIGFYSETLGLPVAYRGGSGFTAIAAGGGWNIGLHATHPGSPTPRARGALSVGFAVADLDAAIATLRGRGLALDSPPPSVGGIRLAHFTDPDGNPLYLYQVAG
ncbi:MAG: hypothetical protein FJ033_07550 [Chloroflexi bacterium]|nr:hypothetical protein [Chloroflexota bacterium]